MEHPDLGQSQQRLSTPELESAEALLVLGEVIPGEDRATAGQHFWDMTSATLQALAEPPPLRRAAVAEVSERCRALGWTLLLHRDMTGEVRRALAVRDSTAQALLGSNPMGLNQAVAVVRNVHTSQRRLVPVSLAQAASLFERTQSSQPDLPGSSSLSMPHPPLGPHFAACDPSAWETGRPWAASLASAASWAPSDFFSVSGEVGW
jgi:hypothetical protein